MARAPDRQWAAPGFMALAGVLFTANALSGYWALWLPLGAAFLAVAYAMWRQAARAAPNHPYPWR